MVKNKQTEITSFFKNFATSDNVCLTQQQEHLFEHKQKRFPGSKILMASVLILHSLFLCPFASAISLPIISQIESSNNPLAVSYRGINYGCGLYQISDVVRREFNEKQNKNYSTNDLFKSNVNEEIASWYLEKRIPQMLRYYKLDVNEKNILMSYNWGIGNVRKYHKGIASMPNETKNYIKKYETARGDQVRLASPLPVSVSRSGGAR
jgi:hypothetical protein